MKFEKDFAGFIYTTRILCIICLLDRLNTVYMPMAVYTFQLWVLLQMQLY